MNKTKFKQTEIGKIPEEWKVKQLIEISDNITDGSHFSPKENLNGKRVIATVKDMRRGGFDFSNCKKITEEDFAILKRNGCSPLKGDILISKDGAKCLDIIFVYNADKEIVLLSSIAIVRLNKDYDPYFYQYYLLSPNAQKIMKDGFVSGSAIPRVILNNFKRVPVPLPPFPEQTAIASILSSLDEKIELNNKMNKTLEAIGQAIFKKWFVEEKGESWRMGKLGDLLELKMGISPKGNSYNLRGVGLPLLNGAADFSGKLILPKKFTSNPIKVCKKGDLVFCIRATIGNLTFADKEYCLGRGVAALEIKEGYRELVYYLLKDSLDEMVSGAYGSVIKGLSKPDIENLEIIMPDELILKKFNHVCFYIFEKQRLLDQQNQTLSQIRDTLLPKLMSGEVRVR